MPVWYPEVSTEYGRARGRQADDVAVFLGLPYARPPVGELRFAAPAPPLAWDGSRDAAAFGPAAPQQRLPLPSSRLPGPGADLDDWLTVNVWTPDPGTGGLPVFVWIHGGAYRWGASGQPVYDGKPLARLGMVVVTCNYRLGVEGFCHVEGAVANRALLDAVAVLRWVRANAAAFGGDPQNVTVAGESAGAGIVASLLAMDSARGLFRQAIAQSMPGTFFSPELAADVAAEIAAAAGLPPTREAFAAMAPAELVEAARKLTESLREYPRWGPVTRTPFSPVVDGEVLPRTPWAALLDGASRDVQLLAGHNREEFRLFMRMTGTLGKVSADRANFALRMLGPGRDGPAAYAQAYRGADPERLYELVNSDWLFRMPTLHLAQAHAASGGRSFLYELTFPAPDPAGALGACHALDVPLVFGNWDLGMAAMLGGASPTPAFEELGSLMRSEWASFIRSGDPGWAPYGQDGRLTRVYDDPAAVRPYPEEPSMRIWERHQFAPLPLLDA